MTGERPGGKSAHRTRSRSTSRRLFCGALGAGALAGCLRLEEGEGSGDGDGNAGGGQPTEDEQRAGVDDGSEGNDAGDSEEIEEDEAAQLELVEAWGEDGLTHTYVDGGRIVGRDSPDVRLVSFDGEPLWESESSDPDSYSVWPSVGRGFAANDDAIFIQYVSFGNDDDDYDARIYAFDADDGTELWRHDTGDDRVTAMKATDDVLYYATRPFDRNEDTPIRALDLDTREYRWERTIGENQHRPGALVVKDGLLYVPQYELYVLNAEDGTTQRELEISQASTRAMADSDTLYLAGGGETAAVSLADESVEWTVSLERAGGVTIQDGVLYAADGSGYVIAHDVESDTQLWEHRVDSAVWTRPSVDAGLVWVYDDDGTVYAVDAEDGERLYRRDTDGGDGRVAAFDGRVYVPGPYYRAYDIERR